MWGNGCLLARLVLLFSFNALLEFLFFFNDCGVRFGLGTSYGPYNQQCESYLEKEFDILYFSHSSQVVLDDLIFTVIINLLILKFLNGTVLKGKNSVFDFISIILGFSIPVILEHSV